MSERRLRFPGRQAILTAMPSKPEHDTYGLVAGGLVAVLHTALTGKDLTLIGLAAAGLGGALGGRLGSTVPDLLEPATSSWHRSTAHSVTVTGAVAHAGVAHVAPLASRLHETADAAPSGPSRALARVGAGAVLGTPAGYVSHTIADAQTARGIPLLTRGF